MRDLVRKAIDGLEQSGRLVSILQRENTQDSLSASVAAGLNESMSKYASWTLV